ncbi:hypothetical protein PLIIFM63780_002498 [Purpureocillium lilacinum]|uniref:glutamate-5-semialdehyde dehydrogenase n=1 Tax=Purpureocillium lilacinum TaxID=33203 RepID=A0A179GA10_PURLI|nr:gamma-glutamyl phosphate reductase [Purpureocillium lilacinum]GJN70910.1 hypothetical protein PLICBS_004970 [Purpureocillium lilacinum]GJN78987.1 hypothetical protein PLIIFM63780_002498 [Purpureocillium lilacinum]
MSLTNASPEAAAAAAKAASFTLAALPASDRNAALDSIHDALAAARDDILTANARDLELARKAAADGSLSAALVSRLDLGKKGKFDDMLRGILDVRDLPDPLGQVQMRTLLDDGYTLERVSCPIGVLLIIFEARPEVIANIAALAVKSGNAAILKGGRESTESFVAISRAISAALERGPVPNDAVQLVTTRDAIAALLAQDRNIDLVIPRGSNDLVRYIKESTKIPVLGHADGLCSIYLTASADAQKAARAVVDAKTSYPAACNSVETLLVQDSALLTVFRDVAAALAAAGVTLRCDPAAKAIASDLVPAERLLDATPADYDTEFLSLDVAVRTVSNFDEAVAHINAHGSHHTDAIFTSDPAEAERFMDQVDSAGAYWNASTRTADGMRYGFGTEVGISTNKIHARGPVGLEGLTIYKYKVRGQYQATADYGEGDGKRPWKHQKLDI